jgi:glycosyltransferase involved in cell wall biosynthesis
MRISIIVACLNARPLLLRCLDSIARQDYCDIEVIVADGGSSDGTAERLRGWQAPSVSSFHWFSGPDAGIADAWNKAIARLSGEWVLFLGADDVLAATDTLSRAAAVWRADPGTRVAYGQPPSQCPGRQVDLLERPWSRRFRGCRYNAPSGSSTAAPSRRARSLRYQLAISADFDFRSGPGP